MEVLSIGGDKVCKIDKVFLDSPSSCADFLKIFFFENVSHGGSFQTFHPNNIRLSALCIYFKMWIVLQVPAFACTYMKVSCFLIFNKISNFQFQVDVKRHIRCKSENTFNENVGLPYVDRERGFLDGGSNACAWRLRPSVNQSHTV